MSPWTNELSHTTRPATSIPTQCLATPPVGTAMQCEIEDPGARIRRTAVAYLPHLLERLASEATKTLKPWRS